MYLALILCAKTFILPEVRVSPTAMVRAVWGVVCWLVSTACSIFPGGASLLLLEGSSWGPEKLSVAAGAAPPSSPPARAEYPTYLSADAQLYSWSCNKNLTKELPLNCSLPVGSSRNDV